MADYKSAAALNPSPELSQQLKMAQAKLDETTRKQAADEASKKAAEDRKAREASLARVEQEKQKLAAEEKNKQDARAREVTTLMTTARTNLAAKEYGKALAAAQSAQQLCRTSESEKLIADIQHEQSLAASKSDAERRAAAQRQVEEQKARADAEARKQRHEALLQQARSAVAAKKYDEATSLVGEANKLIPNDPAAQTLIRDAQAGKAATNAETKRKSDYSADIQAARTALTARRFDEAVKAANGALSLYPTDPAATQLLHDAQAGKAAGEGEAKRKADYTADLQAARLSLTGKRYDEAIRSANEALKLYPGDPTATAILRDAQTGKVGADTEAKRNADYAAAIQATRTALAGKQYDIAVKDAQDALKLHPGDPTAAQLLHDAQAGKASAEGEAKRRADYTAQMTLGQQALAGKRYPDAVRAYTEALRLVPGDAAATKGLNDARTGEKPPPPPPPAPDYNKSILNAQAFERQKMWDAAAAAFRNALKAKPGDPKAAFGLDVVEGQKALDAKKWADAQKFFEDALRLSPNDADAKALLKRAKDMR